MSSYSITYYAIEFWWIEKNYFMFSKRRDVMQITFHNFLIKVGNISGFIPWVNLSKNTLESSVWAKTYSGYVVVFICVTYFIQCLKLQVSELINVSLLYSTLLTIVSGTFIHRKHWQHWFKFYRICDKMIKGKLNETMEPKWRENWQILASSLILSCLTVGTMVIENTNELGFHILYVTMRLFLYILPIFFLMILQKGFKLLNRCSEYQNYREHVVNMASEITVNNASFCRILYRNLFSMSVCLNNVFNWVFVTTLLDLLIGICYYLNEMVTLKYNKKLNLENTIQLSWYFIFNIVSTLFFFIFIITKRNWLKASIPHV